MSRTLHLLPAACILALAIPLAGCKNVVAGNTAISDVMFDVKIQASAHGSVTVTPRSGVSGTTIHVSVNPDPGYVLDKGTLAFHVDKDNDSVSYIDMTKLSFDLASYSVWISSVFVPAPSGDLTVSIGSLQHGSITALPQYGPPGTAITLRVTPDEGYKAAGVAVDGVAVSGLPYQFSLGSANATVTAVFEPTSAVDFVGCGKNSLTAGDFDTAFGYFESAYREDPANADAVVYSSLGKLAAILNDGKVRTLLKKLDMYIVPGTTDEWLSQDWLSSYGGPMLPTLGAPAGFIGTFINTDYYSRNTANPTPAWWGALLFWNIIASYPNGIDDLVDNSLAWIFSDSFDEALARTKSLRYDQRVLLNANLAKELNLGKVYGTGDIYIGRAELELVLSALGCIKAGLEWLDAYELNTYVSPLKIQLSYDDTFNSYLNYLFTNSASAIAEKVGPTSDSSMLSTFLPLRNDFFKDRNNGMMVQSKADLLQAVKTMEADFQYLHQQDTDLTSTARATLTNNAWLPDCMAKLEAAIEAGTDFYFPSAWPTAGTASWDYTQANAACGVNMANFFSPGYLSLEKAIVTVPGGKAPVFFGVQNGTGGVVIGDGEAASFNKYSSIGIKLDMDLIRGVFVKGFDQYEHQEWLQTLVPEAYFTPANAFDLFTLYYKR